MNIDNMTIDEIFADMAEPIEEEMVELVTGEKITKTKYILLKSEFGEMELY